MQTVSPALLECCNLELAVPGTYRAGKFIILHFIWQWPPHLLSCINRMTSTCCKGMPVVTIASFAPQLVVITSKQRPRKLTIHGSDGQDYAFLLKGHEDLRQDERVMQVLTVLLFYKS